MNKYDDNGCRWERSEHPHPKFPRHLHAGLLPDVIWIRFHTVFRGEMTEDVTGWQSTDPLRSATQPHAAKSTSL